MLKKNSLVALILGMAFLVAANPAHQLEDDILGCTVIGVGHAATIDGSVITSHTDCCSECRVHVVPGKKHKKGEMAPVYWGIQEIHRPLKVKTTPARIARSIIFLMLWVNCLASAAGMVSSAMTRMMPTTLISTTTVSATRHSNRR